MPGVGGSVAYDQAMLAVEAPLLKLTVAAGVFAAIAAFAPHGHCHHARHHDRAGLHKLVLHASSLPANRAIYLSEFELNSNDFWENVDPANLTPMEFEIHATVYGCHWVANEVFIPAGDHFTYSYADHIESCGPDGTPTNPTPRSGTVTIE
jgi:hypothetical protein